MAKYNVARALTKGIFGRFTFTYNKKQFPFFEGKICRICKHSADWNSSQGHFLECDANANAKDFDSSPHPNQKRHAAAEDAQKDLP